MFDSKSDSFILDIPPWPNILVSSYRYFNEGEKHVTRITWEYVLIFVLKNTLLFTENGYDITLEKGEWYIQLPGLKQEARTGSPAPQYYYIHFNTFSLPNIKDEPPTRLTGNEDWFSPRRIIMPVRGRFDEKYFRPLFDQLDLHNGNNPSVVLGRQSIFLNIMNKLLALSANSGTKIHNTAIEVMNYLTGNYDRQITFKELAQKFNYSPDYLTRIMKDCYNVTPWQYIQTLRFGKAKELLYNTDYSMSYIAEKTGYNDVSVFYKAFKKQTGMSPGEWRHKSRGF